MKTKLLLVDDVTRLREELRGYLQSEFEIVGEAGDGLAAVEVCRRLRPQLVIMDIVMPKMSGIEATRLISEVPDAPKVIVLSGLRDENIVLQALQAGAVDFLFKPVDIEKLREVLRGFAAEEMSA